MSVLMFTESLPKLADDASCIQNAAESAFAAVPVCVQSPCCLQWQSLARHDEMSGQCTECALIMSQQGNHGVDAMA